MATLSMCTASQSANSAGLADIRSPDCNLAIWDRSGLSGVAALMSEEAKDIRFSTSLANLEEQLASRLADSGFADLPLRNDLIERDVIGLLVVGHIRPSGEHQEVLKFPLLKQIMKHID